MQSAIVGDMATKAKVNFRGAEWGRRLFNAISSEQTKRLVDYAEVKIKSIGDSISSYSSRHNMDRTGNLLDSLCWVVYRNGKQSGHGYYRAEQAYEDSNLHEWSNPMGESVNGHFLAQQFIATYKPKMQNGWEIFFAVLAPYWGYWEKGHPNKRSGKTQKWSVMAMHYDVIKQDLTPASVTFHTYKPS